MIGVDSNNPNKLPLPFYWGLVPFLWMRLTGWRDQYGSKAQFIVWRG